ncbi:hypothetical protein BKA82DRAFT_2913838 [Pisolithus tinctorius]|nr:hypothetical protein BKA82DRAFT_2913838 [Pisolithus tinctorius]
MTDPCTRSQAQFMLSEMARLTSDINICLTLPNTPDINTSGEFRMPLDGTGAPNPAYFPLLHIAVNTLVPESFSVGPAQESTFSWLSKLFSSTKGRTDSVPNRNTRISRKTLNILFL